MNTLCRPADGRSRLGNARAQSERYASW